MEDREEDEEPPLDTHIYTVPICLLESVLRHASNLKCLVWKVGYIPPHSITEALHAHQPKAKLNIFRAKRLADRVGLLPLEQALAASPCLNTFSMTASDGTCIEDHMAFQVIVALAPNLRYASLVSQTIMRPGDPEFSSPRARPEPWFPKGRENSKPNSSLRHLTLDGWSIDAIMLEYWSKYVDLASLESFKCSRGSIYDSYFMRASQLLTNLKHVSINLSQSQPNEEPNEQTAAAVEQYFSTCHVLSTLSLWSWRSAVSLPTILSRHGPTLTALHLHERDNAYVAQREALTIDEIRLIAKCCPRLKECTFDLNRASRELDLGDHADTMEQLRQFKLDNLQIYLDCGLQWLVQHRHRPAPRIIGPSNNVVVGLPDYCAMDDEYADALASPAIDSFGVLLEGTQYIPPSTNREICRFLIAAWKAVFGSQSSGSRQLHLKTGEWEGRNIPLLTAQRGTRDVRVWCTASPHERDDMQGECVVEIQCCHGQHKRKFVSS